MNKKQQNFLLIISGLIILALSVFVGITVLSPTFSHNPAEPGVVIDTPDDNPADNPEENPEENIIEENSSVAVETDEEEASETKKTESKTQNKTPVQKAEEEGPAVERTAYVDHRVLDSKLSGYAKYVEHYNQTRIMDIITSENEIA